MAGLSVGGGGRTVIMGIGMLLFLNVYLARRRSRYIVTNQRVKKKTGLLSTSTGETRLSNINGISTGSGILEGLVGKGTVSITDAAGETFPIKGVGDYEKLARTLRERHQQSMQPGRGHGAAAQPGPGPAQHRGGSAPVRQAQQGADGGQNSSQSGDRAAAESTEAADSPKDRCLECGSRVDAGVSFCPECGADDPFTPSTSDGTDETAAETDTEPAPERDTPTHPIASIAESVAKRCRPDSSAATELCQTLSAEETDERRLEDALEAAVDTLETAATVTDAVERVDDPTERRQLESARRTITGERGRLPAEIEPILDRTIAVSEDLEACEREREQLREAADAVCQAARRNTRVKLRSGDVTDRTVAVAEAIEDGDLGGDSTEPIIPAVAGELERSMQPESSQSRELLETLEKPESDGVEAVLRSTVDSLDSYADLRATVADIGERDVRRRLDALDDELGRKDGDVYRHLADRVRELEAMLERDGVTDVQLYAIYQESTFYDRTLLPRLSRSLGGDGEADLERSVADLDDRIDAIEREYIDVRADHNHTIPRHFLSLADDLRAEAQRVDGDSPMRAAGLCSAADEVLGHVEALYERNEYSVMLRRLRG
ncbi:PH domain-containing protein [Natrinema sp. SYSU A 869]|uniref:PH domain-containing protein n=1 Tax=Natrinema sp. SYSU A 869 TaxID=2871694 RepID=UPI001CA3E6BD|nr:PH domain-containing protein [Natrinema sp. SYSU A 869]